MVRSSIARRAAEKVAPLDVARLMPRGVDIVGDIAIIKVPHELLEKSKEVADALLKEMRNIRSVYRQVSPAQGATRVRGVEWLAGERKTETLHKEHGCLFKVDIAKVYFSPRLLFERERVAKIVAESAMRNFEVVFNMFAGVGSFSIVISKKAERAIVYSADVNPYAFEYMVENINLNGLRGRVIPLLKDAEEVALAMPGKFTRILMPLPELAYDYLSLAVTALRDEGWIHYYDHIYGARRDEVLRLAEEKVVKKLKELNVNFRVDFKRVVRSVGPKLNQVALDIFVKKIV